MLNTLPSSATASAEDFGVLLSAIEVVEAVDAVELPPQAASPKLSADTPTRERNCLREIFFMFNPPEKILGKHRMFAVLPYKL
jgi:hypothetical protein